MKMPCDHGILAAKSGLTNPCNATQIVLNRLTRLKEFSPRLLANPNLKGTFIILS